MKRSLFGLLAVLTAACRDVDAPTASQRATHPSPPALSLTVGSIQTIDLGTLSSGGGSDASDINDAGIVVGFASDPDHYLRPVRWTAPGVIHKLGGLGGIEGAAEAINNEGTIVGYSANSHGLTRAFVWSDGNMTELRSEWPVCPPGAPCLTSEANGISDDGAIAGMIFIALNGQQPEHAVRWESSSAQSTSAALYPTELPGTARDVNNAGIVVGHVHGTNTRPFFSFWGQWEKLPLPPHASGPTYGQAERINNQDVIVGWTEATWHEGDDPEEMPSHALRWTHPIPLNSTYAVQDLGTLGGRNSRASDVNEDGTIVGWSDVYVNFLPVYRAFIWREGMGMKALPPLPGYAYSQAYGINKSNWVVGTSTKLSGERRATLWKVTLREEISGPVVVTGS